MDKNTYNGKPLGAMIKQARKDRKLTQSELADLVGIATTTLQRYEYGERSPSHDVLMAILNSMKISYTTFLSLYGTPEPLNVDAQTLDDMWIIDNFDDVLNRIFKDLTNDDIASLEKYADFLRSQHNTEKP